MKTSGIVFFFCLLLCSACSDYTEEAIVLLEEKENSANTSLLTPIKQWPVLPNQHNRLPSNMHVNEQYLVYLSLNPDMSSDSVICVDKKTGQPLWQSRQPAAGQSHSTLLLDNTFYAASNDGLYALDLATGTKLHSFNFRGRKQLSYIAPYLYYAARQQGMEGQELVLYRLDKQLNIVDVLFREAVEKGSNARLSPSAEWISPEGDQIYIFQKRGYNFETDEAIVNLIAYNASRQEPYFRFNDIDRDGNSSITLPVVYNNKVYFEGYTTFSCIDLLSKQILWQRFFDGPGEQLLSAEFIARDGRIIINPNNEKLYCLDAETGQTRWERHDSGATVQKMIYHDGYIYFASWGDGKLYGIDVHDGSQIWKEDSPFDTDDYPNAGFALSIAIDPHEEVLYASDRVFVMALNLISN